MADKPNRLLKLAEAAFPDLTPSEREVIEAAARGKAANFQSKEKEENDPARSETWPDERKVRAEVLRWLCIEPGARRLVDPKGVQVRGARIEGPLDLAFAVVPFPLGLMACAISQEILLLDARTASVNLNGSHTGAINADRIKVGGAMLLREGFRAQGEVRLLGARVRGNLDCTGGTFEGAETETPEGKTILALSVDGIEVGGGVFLREGFHAQGEVRLLGARIRGNLSCTGGVFENQGKDALSADGMDVSGALFMGKGFKTTGKVSLAYAKARVLADDKISWPAHGDLELRGFLYEGVVGPTDSKSRLVWLARQYPAQRRRGHFHPQPYEQLAAVLRKSGHVAESKKVLVAKERDLRKYGDLGRLAQAWNWLLEVTIGYGYRVRRALGFALVIVLAGFLFFWLGEQAGLLSPTFSPPSEANASRPKRLDEAFCPFVYSLDTFLPIVNLYQEGRWLPNRGGGDVVTTFCSDRYVSITWGKLLFIWFWLEIGAGWLLTTLALAGLTGLVRRD